MKINAQAGHTIFVKKVDRFPGHPASPANYASFYQATNFDADGAVFFYLAKGFYDPKTGVKAPKEVHVWYPNGVMWASFGKSFQDAIDGAQRDGWLAARPLDVREGGAK